MGTYVYDSRKARYIGDLLHGRQEATHAPRFAVVRQFVEHELLKVLIDVEPTGHLPLATATQGGCGWRIAARLARMFGTNPLSISNVVSLMRRMNFFSCSYVRTTPVPPNSQPS